MSKPHVHAELIKAWADGAEIEFLSMGGTWMAPDEYPSWHPETQYRIKPTPKPDAVRYGVASIEGGLAYVNYLGPINRVSDNNLKLTFDGETGTLKAAEVLK